MLTPGQHIKTFTSEKDILIVVRTPQEEDAEQMLLFINDLVKEDTYILRAPGSELSLEEERDWVKTVIADMESGERIPLLGFADDKLIVNCEITKRTKRESHIGDLHISVSKEFRDQGIGEELIKTLIELAKKDMSLRILTLGVFANNPRAISLYKKLGFVEYGILPEALFYQNTYVDEVKMYLKLV